MRRALTVLVAAVSFASTVAMGGSPKSPLRVEVLRHTPMGYFGCFVGVNVDHYSCLAARRSQAGVKIIVFRGVDLSEGPLAKPTVKEALLPHGSLYAFLPPSGGGPGVALDATLLVIGAIHLKSRATLYTKTTGNEGCPAYAVHYELVGSGPRAVGVVTHDTGTIGGVQVRDLGCNAYFTKATTGVWWMLAI